MYFPASRHVSHHQISFLDLHEYMGGPHAVPRTPHPVTGEKLPTTLGHEFSGIIEEVGADVTDLKVGDKVAVKPNLSDGTCWSCSIGRLNCCNSLGFIGYSGELFLPLCGGVTYFSYTKYTN